MPPCLFAWYNMQFSIFRGISISDVGCDLHKCGQRTVPFYMREGYDWQALWLIIKEKKDTLCC